MHHHKRRARSIALLTVGAFIGTMLVALPVQAAGQPPLDVRVVNTTAEPVPVAVQGTPTVKVDASAAPVPVAVQGTPTVKLDTTAPLMIRNADEPALQAVQRSVVVVIAAGSQVGTVTMYTVPAGKRLVIESETAKSQLSQGVSADVVLIGSFAGAGFGYLVVPQQHLGPFAGEGDIWVGNSDIRRYADPGTPVSATVDLDSGAGQGARVEVSFSGYLVDL